MTKWIMFVALFVLSLTMTINGDYATCHYKGHFWNFNEGKYDLTDIIFMTKQQNLTWVCPGESYLLFITGDFIPDNHIHPLGGY